MPGRRGRRPAGCRRASSRIVSTVHPGASSWGTCPTPCATSNCQAGFAAAAARAVAMWIKRSLSPCRRSTGTSIDRCIAANRRRSARTHISDCAAESISESTSGYSRRLPASSTWRSTTSLGTRDMSAQHRRSSACAASCADWASRRRLSTRRPTTGTRNVVNVANTRGSGRALSAGGSAGSTSTRPATLSGRCDACRIEMRPPIEFPTRIAGTPATSVRKRCSNRWLACTDVERDPPRVCPNPARSSATTRQLAARTGATAAQFSADPPNPWTHTSRGPSEGPP